MTEEPDSDSETAETMAPSHLKPIDPAESVAPHVDVTKAVTKLEVLSSKQFNKLTRINLYALVYSVVYILVTRVWLNVSQVLTAKRFLNGKMYTFTGRSYIPLLAILDLLMYNVSMMLPVILTPVYIIRVFRNNKSPSNEEQRMIALFLILACLVMNPLWMYYIINDIVLAKGDPSLRLSVRFKWFTVFFRVCWALMGISTHGLGLLYVWYRLHEFRFTENIGKKALFRRILLPKIMAFIFYMSVWVVGITLHGIQWSWIPFNSLICFLKIKNAIDFDTQKILPFIAIVTGMEFLIIISMIISAMRTYKELRNVDYCEHRSRIVAFRFFCFHALFYKGGIIFFGNLTALITPNFLQLLYLLDEGSPTNYLFNQSAHSGHCWLLGFLWTIITAYVSLPADSIGLRGWFRPCDDENLRDIEPITLNKNPETITSPNVFAVHSQIFYFNMSWLAYTKKENIANLEAPELAYGEIKEIIDDSLDVRVIILDLPDRIVLAFRGTTTNINIKTDLRVDLVPLNDYLPSKTLDGNKFYEDFKGWRRAKIHHGFATACSSVQERIFAELQLKLAERRRPIFLTGHSLGGALATVCALDLCLSCIVDKPEDISVSTFGSPKCGNKSWRDVYEKVIKSHWNVKIDNDVVTMLPKVQYCHVGKTALMTSTGNFVLDPSAVDLGFWSGELPSINNHKKPAYKMALTIVSSKYFNLENTGIWNFPIKETFINQWEKSCGLSLSPYQVRSLANAIEDNEGASTTVLSTFLAGQLA